MRKEHLSSEDVVSLFEFQSELTRRQAEINKIRFYYVILHLIDSAIRN
jgi:hypothetical protein